MSWRLRYEAWIDFVPPGIGPMSGTLSPMTGQIGGAGPSQTLEFLNAQGGQNVAGAGAGNALAAADITALLASMTTDLSAQMNAALGRLNTFQSGGG